jgi:hypothetical protein
MPSPTVHKEVRDRMCGVNGSGVDLVMREVVQRYGTKWISLEQIYAIACKHGVELSPFRPWVLYTCVLTFPRAVELNDVPWGTYLPYFTMSSHSAMHEARFRIAPEFASYAPITK